MVWACLGALIFANCSRTPTGLILEAIRHLNDNPTTASTWFGLDRGGKSAVTLS
jgi:hypothetical protein